jgi:hypothetical protein
MAAKKSTKNGSATKKGNNKDRNKDKDKYAFDDKIVDTARAAKICAAAGFFLYFNSIVVCEFPYDDHRAVINNPDVIDQDGDGVMSPFVEV